MSNAGTRKTSLVISSNFDFRFLLERILSTKFTSFVKLAGSAADARQLLQMFHFDLIVTDFDFSDPAHHTILDTLRLKPLVVPLVIYSPSGLDALKGVDLGYPHRIIEHINGPHLSEAFSSLFSPHE